MTPKDKAEKLLKKMLSKNPNIQDGISRIDTIQAKLCALVAVDEIIESKKLEYLFTFQEITLLNFTKDDRLVHSKFINYWEQVKQEIEKL